MVLRGEGLQTGLARAFKGQNPGKFGPKTCRGTINGPK